MKSQKLQVEGAFVFTPQVFRDDRGVLLATMEEDAFTETVGHPPFPVRLTACSRSRRGAVRGMHYTATPPGIAKYVHCSHGAVLDIIVDTRVGSPTFGEWDSVLLDENTYDAVYLPVGVAHAYQALVDDSVVHYLASGTYHPDHEKPISALDPALGLPISSEFEAIMSEHARTAPTLAEAKAAGLLPDYAECLEIEAKFRNGR
ncbi:dTDP-4-dehydrorhamnose 3,5-epimerase family protein [Kibdelosporangium aridum]|nr:dTDP-4-dehydrorhamnose 3,5-epimerase family protein [Kibdelosporangium aridum]